MWIKVNGYDYYITATIIIFHIAYNIVIVRFGKLYVPCCLQGCILMSYLINAKNDLSDFSIACPVPAFYLILFIVYIFFLACHRLINSQFINWSIKTVI